MTNTRKLKGRMVEYNFNLTRFSHAMGMTRPTLNNKLYNRVDFLSSEIKKACELLEIGDDEIAEYFLN